MRNNIDCQSVRRLIPVFVDGVLPQERAAELRSHAADCPECSLLLGQTIAARRAVRSLPKLHVPVVLTTALRVKASRESARQARWRSWPAFATSLRQDFSLWFNNLMRPIALPFAGGLMTSTLVFSMIIGSYPITAQSFYDVPIWPKERITYSEATLKQMAPLEFTGADVTVDLVINEQGRALGYRFAGGTQSNNPAVRRTVENILLFTEFNPAMAAGQRVSGKVRLSFRRSHIEVRG